MKNTLWHSPYMTSVHQNYPPILNLGFDILIHIDPGSHLVTVPFPKVLKLSCTGQSQLKNILWLQLYFDQTDVSSEANNK